MSFTNSTEHYGLPQWIGNNTPTFLVDFNNAFLAIDNAIYARVTNAENLQNQINSAVDTITVLQDRILAFDEDFGDLPAEVAGLKTQVQILSTHEQEHDVDIKNIRKEIENIQTTASQLAQNMTEMFRTRDAALETYKEHVNSDFEEIRGEVAGNSADFALLKNGLYEGDVTEENPLGERKFALKSEIHEPKAINFYSGGNNRTQLDLTLIKINGFEQWREIDVSALEPGFYSITSNQLWNSVFDGSAKLSLKINAADNGSAGQVHDAGGTLSSVTTIASGFFVKGEGVNYLYPHVIDSNIAIRDNERKTIHLLCDKLF